MNNQHITYPKHANDHAFMRGFTLIEIMIVLVLIGIMVSLVQFSFQSNPLENELKKASSRFAGTFTVAAEYSTLNNVELGILIEDNRYQFLGFDGKKWAAFEDNELLSETELPEHLQMVLNLEGLPIDENALITSETFKLEDESLFDEGDDFKESDKNKKLIPQIVILSGGEISPFTLTFSASDEFDESDIAYNVTGLYTMPLTIKGPISLEEAESF